MLCNNKHKVVKKKVLEAFRDLSYTKNSNATLCLIRSTSTVIYYDHIIKYPYSNTETITLTI